MPLLRSLSARTLLACASLALPLLAALAAAAAPADEDAAVIAAEHATCDAFRTGDAATLRKLISADFTLTNSRSKVSTREDEIAEVTSGKYTYEEFRNHDMQVRRYGDTAIVLGVTTLKGTAEGAPFAVDVRFTDTLVKQKGQWVLVAGHTTKLDPP